MNNITFRNGFTVSIPVLCKTIRNLTDVLERSPDAFADLIERCSDVAIKSLDNSEQKKSVRDQDNEATLKDCDCIDETGHVPNHVKMIVMNVFDWQILSRFMYKAALANAGR
ncbi:MAG TPA: hypothetical protein VLE95_00010 [Chlamydiales bacterium]|nr:hypothetical protein [Chlamydiales bacterium]